MRNLHKIRLVLTDFQLAQIAYHLHAYNDIRKRVKLKKDGSIWYQTQFDKPDVWNKSLPYDNYWKFNMNKKEPDLSRLEYE